MRGSGAEKCHLLPGERRSVKKSEEKKPERVKKRTPHRAEDDVGTRVRERRHDLRHLVHLCQRHVPAARDVIHHARRALDGALDQGRGRGGVGGLAGAALSAGDADAEHGSAGVAHDGLDVGEVDVDLFEKGEREKKRAERKR